MKACSKRALALFAALACILTGAAAAFAQTPAEACSAVLVHLTANVPAPVVNSVGGEWAVLALARGNAAVPSGYYDGYVSRVKQTLRSNGGVLPSSSTRKTEYSRVVIALSALGEDAANFDGRSLLLPLANFGDVTAQGINGAIYALIAFDTRDWEIPAIADSAQQVTRQRLIEFILNRELGGGGFTQAGTAVSAEITAMVLQAFAPYQSDAAIQAATGRALAALSNMQLENGGFGHDTEGETSESAAQVVAALASLGIDPAADTRFAKPGGNPLTALLKFQKPNGSFDHGAAGTGNTQMAAEQAACALAAYDRFQNGKTALYDMSDVTPKTQLDAAKADRIAAVRAVTDGLRQADYTAESWSALQAAITNAIAAVYAAASIDAVNAVAIPTIGGLVLRPQPKWWESPPLPAFLHLILRVLFFGWIWMR